MYVTGGIAESAPVPAAEREDAFSGCPTLPPCGGVEGGSCSPLSGPFVPETDVRRRNCCNRSHYAPVVSCEGGVPRRASGTWTISSFLRPPRRVEVALGGMVLKKQMSSLRDSERSVNDTLTRQFSRADHIHFTEHNHFSSLASYSVLWARTPVSVI
jgi:hypothetical protein